MFNSIPISCNQAEVVPRGRAMQARACRVLFASVIGPPLFCSPWHLFSILPFVISASSFHLFPSPPHVLLLFPSLHPSPPLWAKTARVVICDFIFFFFLFPASAASGHWLQNPLSFVYFNYANEDSSAGLLEAAGEKAVTPLRVITIHPLVSLWL